MFLTRKFLDANEHHKTRHSMAGFFLYYFFVLVAVAAALAALSCSRRSFLS